MSNWYMINTFVSNSGTATVLFFLLFVNYRIVFNLLNLFIYFFHSLTSRFLYLLLLSNVVVLVAYVIAVAPIVWISRS